MGYNKNSYKYLVSEFLQDDALTREQRVQRAQEIRALFQEINERSEILQQLEREVAEMNRKLLEIQQNIINEDFGDDDEDNDDHDWCDDEN